MSNYIVTGGAGFIGHHLVNRLIADGHRVCVFDNFSRGRLERVNPEVELWRQDITKKMSPSILDKYRDGIFHLAALARVPFSLEYPLESNNANVVGTLNILENARKAGIKNIVFSSSSSVYGNGTDDCSEFKETDGLNPISPYALQKVIGENYCKLYSLIHSMNTIALRYFSVYGPGTRMTDTYNLVLTTFLDQFKRKVPFTITGDGKQTRDFTHVDDVIDANLKAMRMLQQQKDGYHNFFNIGAGENHSVIELASLFTERPKIDYIDKRLEPLDTLANNKKAKEIMGWFPKRNFRESVLELISQEIGLEPNERN